MRVLICREADNPICAQRGGREDVLGWSAGEHAGLGTPRAGTATSGFAHRFRSAMPDTRGAWLLLEQKGRTARTRPRGSEADSLLPSPFPSPEQEFPESQQPLSETSPRRGSLPPVFVWRTRRAQSPFCPLLVGRGRVLAGSPRAKTMPRIFTGVSSVSDGRGSLRHRLEMHSKCHKDVLSA